MAVSSCTDAPCSDVATRYADALREALELRRAEQEASLQKSTDNASTDKAARTTDPTRLLDITV